MVDDSFIVADADPDIGVGVSVWLGVRTASSAEIEEMKSSSRFTDKFFLFLISSRVFVSNFAGIGVIIILVSCDIVEVVELCIIEKIIQQRTTNAVKDDK